MNQPSSFSNRGSRSWILLGGALLICAALLIAVRYRSTLVTPPRVETPPAQTTPDAQLTAGKQLYGNYCAECHGDQGDGNGPAARFLYPRPRNFRQPRFRVVTTNNLIPSDEDLLQVITRGMPGSAMLSFAHLSEADRKTLVGHLRSLTRAGILEQQKAEQGNSVNPADLEQAVDQLLQPGPAVVLPSDVPAAGPESIARGAKLYASAGCVSCHGQTGKGDGTQEQRDDMGMPIRPRDLTRGFFKGGHEPRQLFARILLGMPGSPMPASPKTSPAELVDLVNFVLSLSDAERRASVEHKRQLVVAKRVQESLDREIPESAWLQAKPVAIVLSPLWWREFIDPQLQVAALHNGKSLAVRLSWRDESCNDAITLPQDFEDMAAVQLFKGSPEPFLGMGAADKRLDLWLWRASWQRPAVQPDTLLDSYPFDSPVYREVTKGKEKDNPDFLTARAAGNGNANADRSISAGSLVARGFGSVTFRPKTSQLVTASAAWKDGRWTVVLRRPLVVGEDDGLPLNAGEKCSLAFAIWDGAARDRNGQKLVSIWNDLQVE